MWLSRRKAEGLFCFIPATVILLLSIVYRKIYIGVKHVKLKRSVSKTLRWYNMRKLVFGLVVLFSLLAGSAAAMYYQANTISPVVKVPTSYDLIHNGQLLFPDAWHPKPLKLYYDSKFIPAISSDYEIRLPYVLPSSYKTSCQMLKHDGYYFVTTDIHCY